MALSFLLRNQMSSKGCIFKVSDLVSKQALKTCSFGTLHQHTAVTKKNEQVSLLHNVKVSDLCSSQMRPFSTSNRLFSGKDSDHSALWGAERVASAALLGLIPAIFFVPSQTLETLTAVITVMHCHWGLEAIFVDYIREKLFGPVWPKVSIVFCYLLSIFMLAGLLNIIFNDTGLANTLRLFWKL
ncbi:succinate dehydrogenase [ubiquinone] cytochrome b small subunit, mitochondrial [Nilaparvata lugens]|uniref:succinate dehydrogenase [ubiquinone] cytochrome b small subunit, mitochondrial n=1 Tax=Nilaparvata lugens TaxID=108931 RepID=UPI00193CB642|nr:succinate dehydrogenase [ubiquinone] cytochrome b small subunit, mitochondrial [Nilaparvata lugens]